MNLRTGPIFKVTGMGNYDDVILLQITWAPRPVQAGQALNHLQEHSLPCGALVPRNLQALKVSEHHLDATLALAGGLWRSTLVVT